MKEKDYRLIAEVLGAITYNMPWRDADFLVQRFQKAIWDDPRFGRKRYVASSLHADSKRGRRLMIESRAEKGIERPELGHRWGRPERDEP